MAGVQETAQWENHVYRIEENDPVHGGEEGVTNKPIKHLANRTLYLRRLLTEAGQRINPKKITASSRNSNDLTGHTHEIDLASLTTKGLVQLTNDTGLDSEVLALTAKGGKALAQQIAQTQQRLTEGLNQKPNKSDISSAVNSESTTQLANSKAVKIAYDKAMEAKTAADGAYQVDRANQNRNLNILLGQNTVWGTANRGGSLTGLGNIYNYGVGLAMSAGGANAMLYIAHSHAGINNGVWVQASFSGNNSTPIWRRIDGTEWDEIRNNPLNVQRNLGTTDLNSVTGIGFYGQETYTNATTARNYPELIAGSLLVTPFGDGLIQEYSATNGRKYSRKRGGDRVWSDWVRIDGVGKLNGAGDTMTGTLEIKNGDWSKLMLTNSANKPLIFESQPDNTETFGSFFYRGEGSQKEAETKLPKAFGTLALREDFTYQKIGNFEVRKYPDGTMIQTNRYTPPSGKNNSQNKNDHAFNWAIAFVSTPHIFAQQINTDRDAFGSTDLTLSINHSQTNAARVVFSTYEVYYNNHSLDISFLAIGRWK